LKCTASGKLLDIGTGTGLLSLMIRQKNNLAIEAIEIDEPTAVQAATNVAASPWPNAISIIQGDVLQLEEDKKYNYIISNPPFYEGDLQSPDAKRNTAHHGNLLTLNKLLDIIMQHLECNGLFFLLLPFKRKKELEALVTEMGLNIYKELVLYQTGKHGPFRLMVQGGNDKREKQSDTLVIADNTNQYTPAFISLLADYYLNL
ncbi:MAG TPA: methyltransferase, partial [Chitinophagaceae bacterium]|nr:methyltransferase [Chitinophagaceae bacterium]